MTRLPSLDDYDRNYGDDDPADVEDRLSIRETITTDLEIVRAADEALINLSGRGEAYHPPKRCQHVFQDGRSCTYTVAACPGHTTKSWREFVYGTK